MQAGIQESTEGNIMKKSSLLGAVCIILFLTGCATSAVIKDVKTKDVKEIKIGETSKPLQFRKIVIKLRRGTHIGAWKGGLLCVPQGDLTWKGGKVDISSDDFNESFRDVLESANYKIVGDPDALFEDPSEWKAEYLIAGLVKDLDANICYPWSGYGNFTKASGEAYIKVEWQIYSRLDREVVHKVVTEGDYKVSDSSPTGGLDAILGAFEEAANNLLADEEFYALIVGDTLIAKAPYEKNNFENIYIDQSVFKRNLSSHPLSNARSSVVTIFAGDGHGSGYFISNDGHVLTNAHVVGGAKYVAVKTDTGEEIVGSVIRKDKRRDVALIKIDKQTPPIIIRTHPAKIGEEVYAIGSPLDKNLSSSISKGIISSYREIDGMDYLQSDVNVLPGSSGGPLIDSNGKLLGMTVSGRIFKDVPAGINFFIPVHSALDSLSLDAKP